MVLYQKQETHNLVLRARPAGVYSRAGSGSGSTPPPFCKISFFFSIFKLIDAHVLVNKHCKNNISRTKKKYTSRVSIGR